MTPKELDEAHDLITQAQLTKASLLQVIAEKTVTYIKYMRTRQDNYQYLQDYREASQRLAEDLTELDHLIKELKKEYQEKTAQVKTYQKNIYIAHMKRLAKNVEAWPVTTDDRAYHVLKLKDGNSAGHAILTPSQAAALNQMAEKEHAPARWITTE